MAEAKRLPCRECSREALVETIDRNDGICEPCAKGNGTSEISTIHKVLFFAQILIAISVTAYVAHRLGVFGWHWIWIVVFLIMFFSLVSEGVGYLLGGLLWIYEKLRESDPLNK